jgi:DNA-binding transcriptional LysR family regulator
MELRELRCFVAACELRSVSAAARKVGRVQPAVSNALGRLESELGVRLLLRHPSGVEPTAAGLALLRHAQTILGAVDRAAGEMTALSTGDPEGGGPRGEVRLGLAGPAPPGVVSGTLRHLAATAPGLDVPVTDDGDEPVLDALATGRLDLALLWLPLRREGLEIQALQAFPLVAVAAADRPPAALDADLMGSVEDGRAATATVLAETPWIAFPAGTVPRLWLDAAALRADVAPRVAREARTWTACRAALEAGLGAALVPAPCAEPELLAGTLRAWPMPRAGHAILGVARAAGAAPSAAVRTVDAALAEVAAAAGARAPVAPPAPVLSTTSG